LVRGDVEAPEPRLAQHLVDHRAKAVRDHDDPVAGGLAPCDQLGEAGADRRPLAHGLEHLLARGAHAPELLLHRLFDRDLAGPEARLERGPDVPGPEGLDDHVERVATRDRPVEVTGDQQGSHGTASLPAVPAPRPRGGQTREARTRRAGPPESGTTHGSYVEPPPRRRTWRYRTELPLELKRAPTSAPLARVRRRRPVPSAWTSQMSWEPAGPRWNTTSRPSGETEGDVSTPAKTVRRRAGPPCVGAR